MDESPRNDVVTFTDEEWDEFFGAPLDRRTSRRVPVWARLVGLIAAVAMMAGTVTLLVDRIGNFAQINEPEDIRENAEARAVESGWGWLITELIVVPIDEPQVGAFVTNNPPDGIIQIDFRPWSRDRLDRLVDHEIGHLIEFAVWGDSERTRRGGLDGEAWAECAAVAAGTRKVDSGSADDEYHCFADELADFETEIAALDLVCPSWVDECRPVPSRP